MLRALYLAKVMDGLPETFLTILISLWAFPTKDTLAIVVLALAAFFWIIRIKREVQQQYFNSLWKAIKSMFKKKNKYGEDKGDENTEA